MIKSYDEIPDKEFFFSWVRNSFRDIIKYFETYLKEELDEEIFNKAVKLGYDRNQSQKKILEIQNRYIDQYHFPINVNTPQNNYCRAAFYLILQEKIIKQKLEIPEQLLLKLTSYDTYLPENYCVEIPSDIKLPKKSKEQWLDFELKLPENLFENNEFVTIYSQSEVKYPIFSEELQEFEELSSALIKNSKIEKIQDMLEYFESKDFIFTPEVNTFEEFKNWKIPSNQGMLYEHIITKFDNKWSHHSESKLVRLSEEFISENNLSWGKVLDMFYNGEQIIKFQFWVGPYNGDRNSRERITRGVRLQIKSSFLKNYLKEKNKSLIIIKEKTRHIVKPSPHHEEGETEEEKIYKKYS